GFVRAGGVIWLTALDQVNRAEGKLAQYAAAARLGIPAPETLVASDLAPLRDKLGLRFVLKPLGPGHFLGDDDQGRVGFATETGADAPLLAHLAGAPFLAQRLVDVRLHLRVVTVRQQTWACSLDASEMPFDWRRRAAAQRAFRPVDPPAEVRAGALRMAGYFELGYSSQDWVLDRSGRAWFLDLNPPGQWLCRPDAVHAVVTRATAGWLGGDERWLGALRSRPTCATSSRSSAPAGRHRSSTPTTCPPSRSTAGRTRRRSSSSRRAGGS